ncbi:MAG: tryptophan synthase subunit alpha [Pseudomonadota bacterium]|nr:tryptophan synthase subunit alpha [Pseudomonadota bacterium]
MTTNKLRIKNTFEEVATDNRAALITFITAGDPNIETSMKILGALPDAGADLIELGMPFTDPMADGPIIQLSSQRALRSGHNTSRTLEMVKKFRRQNQHTPIILMGYFNPIYNYGISKFCDDASTAGVDGLIVVDLPPEEDEQLRKPAKTSNIDFIRLTTPTSDTKRLPKLVTNASGFIYHVSVAGITGAQTAEQKSLKKSLSQIRKYTDLPIAVGFGIKTPEDVMNISKIADAAVVGSAIVEKIADGSDSAHMVENILGFVRSLSNAVQTRPLDQ